MMTGGQEGWYEEENVVCFFFSFHFLTVLLILYFRYHNAHDAASARKLLSRVVASGMCFLFISNSLV
jgi:hypothetical protein